MFVPVCAPVVCARTTMGAGSIGAPSRHSACPRAHGKVAAPILVLPITFVGSSTVGTVVVMSTGVVSVLRVVGLTLEKTEEWNTVIIVAAVVLRSSHVTGAVAVRGSGARLIGMVCENGTSSPVSTLGPVPGAHDVPGSESATNVSFDLCNVGYDSGTHVSLNLAGSVSVVTTGVASASVPVSSPGHHSSPFLVTATAPSVGTTMSLLKVEQ